MSYVFTGSIKHTIIFLHVSIVVEVGVLRARPKRRSENSLALGLERNPIRPDRTNHIATAKICSH